MQVEKQQALLGVGAVGAWAGIVILLVMLVLGASVGNGLEILGQPGTPADYAAALKPAAGVLITVMAVDNLFVIAYTSALAAAVGLIWDRVRVLAVVGLVVWQRGKG